jgi:hypothetical protein
MSTYVEILKPCAILLQAEGAGATNGQAFKFSNGTTMNVTIPMLHFGFPHHQDTIVNATTSTFRLTNLAMMSPTKVSLTLLLVRLEWNEEEIQSPHSL